MTSQKACLCSIWYLFTAHRSDFHHRSIYRPTNKIHRKANSSFCTCLWNQTFLYIWET